MPGQLGKKTRIGRLRQFVTIQSPTTTPAAFRGKVTAWANLEADVRAEVIATGGREIFQSGTTQAQYTHRVRMRYRTDVNSTCRLLWQDTGITLNIVACPPTVGAENLLELWCIVEEGT
ncbi:phage head closure protein [Frigoriglobus tundricola]|uniref:Phage head-tail adaptor n=1 Tax=Frigoriglobus tundricola TaxID=2774151 RepID=A0A6M5YKZ7_9BACT|nr:phage head closure protein [Frigoriglobus tundricola]QJW94697.1 hypothetical protein FTUN_2219 [Frigoriglobus tundricola]